MSVEKMFPKFKVLEMNNSVANRSGHILAQFPAKLASIAHKAVSGYDDQGDALTINVLENGVICGLSKDAELINYSATTCSQPCIVANDELITGFLEGLDQYCEEFEDGVTYPRVLPLYIGDSFTTNNYVNITSAKYAKVVDGVLTLQQAADADTLFSVVKSTLPAGQAAYCFTYVGTVVVSE